MNLLEQTPTQGAWDHAYAQTANIGRQSMDRKTSGDGPLRLGQPSGNDREQTSSNHAEIGQVGEIVEMQHLTPFKSRTASIWDLTIDDFHFSEIEAATKRKDKTRNKTICPTILLQYFIGSLRLFVPYPLYVRIFPVAISIMMTVRNSKFAVSKITEITSSSFTLFE